MQRKRKVPHTWPNSWIHYNMRGFWESDDCEYGVVALS
jgi:hypothetical protein